MSQGFLMLVLVLCLLLAAINEMMRREQATGETHWMKVLTDTRLNTLDLPNQGN